MKETNCQHRLRNPLYLRDLIGTSASKRPIFKIMAEGALHKKAENQKKNSGFVSNCMACLAWQWLEDPEKASPKMISTPKPSICIWTPIFGP